MSKSLTSLLEAFHVPEELDDFDPEAHIGEIKDKIDAIKWRLDQWDAEADMIEEKWIAELERKRKSIINAGYRLKQYVLSVMLKDQWPELPGNIMRVKIQNSPASLVIDREAKVQDYMSFPRYVRQEISYVWMRDAIKSDAKDDVLPVPGASFERGKHIRFYPIGGKK